MRITEPKGVKTKGVEKAKEKENDADLELVAEGASSSNPAAVSNTSSSSSTYFSDLLSAFSSTERNKETCSVLASLPRDLLPVKRKRKLSLKQALSTLENAEKAPKIRKKRAPKSAVNNSEDAPSSLIPVSISSSNLPNGTPSEETTNKLQGAVTPADEGKAGEKDVPQIAEGIETQVSAKVPTERKKRSPVVKPLWEPSQGALLPHF